MESLELLADIRRLLDNLDTTNEAIAEEFSLDSSDDDGILDSMIDTQNATIDAMIAKLVALKSAE